MKPKIYLFDSFKEWFGDELPKPKKVKLKFKTLERDMTDSEILADLQPKKTTLEELSYALNNNLFDKNSYCIGYVKNKSGVLLAIAVDWSADGWSVDAYSVENPSEWGGWRQVFSPEFLSDALTTENLPKIDSNLLNEKINKIKVEYQERQSDAYNLGRKSMRDEVLKILLDIK